MALGTMYAVLRFSMPVPPHPTPQAPSRVLGRRMHSIPHCDMDRRPEVQREGFIQPYVSNAPLTAFHGGLDQATRLPFRQATLLKSKPTGLDQATRLPSSSHTVTAPSGQTPTALHQVTAPTILHPVLERAEGRMCAQRKCSLSLSLPLSAPPFPLSFPCSVCERRVRVRTDNVLEVDHQRLSTPKPTRSEDALSSMTHT